MTQADNGRPARAAMTFPQILEAERVSREQFPDCPVIHWGDRDAVIREAARLVADNLADCGGGWLDRLREILGVAVASPATPAKGMQDDA